MLKITPEYLELSHTEYLAFIEYCAKNANALDGARVIIHGYGDSVSDVDIDAAIGNSPHHKTFLTLIWKLIEKLGLNVVNEGGRAEVVFHATPTSLKGDIYIENYDSESYTYNSLEFIYPKELPENIFGVHPITWDDGDTVYEEISNILPDLPEADIQSIVQHVTTLFDELDKLDGFNNMFIEVRPKPDNAIEITFHYSIVQTYSTTEESFVIFGDD